MTTPGTRKTDTWASGFKAETLFGERMSCLIGSRASLDNNSGGNGSVVPAGFCPSGHVVTVLHMENAEESLVDR